MLLYIYLFLIFVLIAYVSFVVLQNYIYLSSKEYSINAGYNSYSVFRNSMRATYKYYFKRLAKAFSFIIHYIEFIFIKAVNWVINRFDSAYARMINRFLEKSVSNKSYVKFFWKDLKEFKKEIDSKKDL